MSDIDPDLPDYLVDAILSEEPPAEAVDLVKDAFTWRTIDAELMELTYDSILDDAGVRDASARRTLEFNAGVITVVLDIDQLIVNGTVSPPVAATAILVTASGSTTDDTELHDGYFELEAPARGAVAVRISLDGGVEFVTPAFLVG